MIKPGTLCMIRGVPPRAPGADCNGQIVTVEGIKFDDIYLISPALTSQYSINKLDMCPKKYLYPLADFDPQELITSDQELETQ